MAWIEPKKRTDGGTSFSVRWRLGGTRAGRPQVETFGAGSDTQNLARAEGFKRTVAAAGERWPDGWVKGAGFVRDHGPADDPALPARSVEAVGLEYVDQLVDCSSGQRSRYRSQLRTLTAVEVRGRQGGAHRPFDTTVSSVTEDDIKAWLIGWDRSLKTKANYHGLLYGVFNYALEKGEVTQNPLRRTAPKRGKIRQSQADLRFLTDKPSSRQMSIVDQRRVDGCDRCTGGSLDYSSRGDSRASPASRSCSDVTRADDPGIPLGPPARRADPDPDQHAHHWG
ncbi:MAG TPA: hypothetical protein VMU51_04985 [Mycobacteriales bacterium]|nr:hypothetical protein [Mycobacteriales bacterium]